ncbi:hypothetical protein ACI2KR_09260 [Pseudomonas luteola]
MRSFNEVFLQQEEGRQKVLREDKWMLADFAYNAGIKEGQAEVDRLSAELEKLRESKKCCSDKEHVQS